MSGEFPVNIGLMQEVSLALYHYTGIDKQDTVLYRSIMLFT